jgi:hypothetical protein
VVIGRLIVWGSFTGDYAPQCERICNLIEYPGSVLLMQGDSMQLVRWNRIKRCQPEHDQQEHIYREGVQGVWPKAKMRKGDM